MEEVPSELPSSYALAGCDCATRLADRLLPFLHTGTKTHLRRPSVALGRYRPTGVARHRCSDDGFVSVNESADAGAWNQGGGDHMDQNISIGREGV